MDWLLNNSLLNLPGEYFLLLYAVVIATALFVFTVIKSNLDRSDRLALPPVPSDPDPFEIAYLRGGENELARSISFALTQKNLLKVKSGEKVYWIEQSESSTCERLQPIERRTLEYFRQPRQPRELFQNGGLTAELKPFSTTYEARLAQRQLLTSDETRAKLKTWKTIFALSILGLGAYKLTAAVIYGYSNFWFLIIFAVVGTITLLAIGRTPRVTKLGKKYLERLQVAYEKLRYRPAPAPQQHTQYQPAYANGTVAAVDPLLLTVGVFGTAALAGTMYDDYNQAFYKAQQNQTGNSSSCGSGCGTSWDSSSSSSSDGGGSDSGGGSGCGGCGGCS